MGALDEALRTAADVVIDAFTDTRRLFTRRVELYDPITGGTATQTTQARLKITPPAPMNQRESAVPVVAGDMKTSVAALAVTREGFSLDLGDEVTITLQYGCDVYRVYAVNAISSGDEVAMYILQLRR